MSKKRGRRRQRYTREAPLRLAGALYQETPGQARSVGLSRVLHAVVSVLPSFDRSQSGRLKAGAFRIATGAVAIALVTSRESHWGVAVFGVVVALLTLLIPLADTQKVRLLQRVKAMALPKSEWNEVAADVAFDGEKLVLRQEGRVWASMRPFGDEPAETAAYESDGTAYFVLHRGKKKKRREIWFCAPKPDWDEWGAPPKPKREPLLAERFSMGCEDFATLVQAFTGR